jgi:hypothetical protein
MALGYLATEIAAVREKARSYQDGYNSSINQINADATLSDEGKRIALDEERDRAKATMRAFRDSEEALIAEALLIRNRTLDDQVGYSSSDLIAFRDAQDRAERLEGAEEALRVMERALRTSDRSLAHAIFRRSIDARWSAVQAAFLEVNPGLADIASDLQGLDNYNQQSFQRTAFYAVF